MDSRQQDDKFNFFIPATFEKGKKNGKDVTRVKGIASTSSASDSDGETLFPVGFDYTPLLAKGFFNWDHQTKSRPLSIVGEPDVAKVINNGKDFYIEGFLYPDSKDAQEVVELATILEKNSPTRRLGYSIEGQVIERASDDKTDPRYKQVLRARITGVAITPCPKNPNTIMSLVKGEYNDLYVDDADCECVDVKDGKCTRCGKEIKKAFTAEGSVDLRPESVEGVKYDLKKNELTVGGLVRKSEVYNLIAENYTTDIVKAKAIYSLIENVNHKMFNMTNGEISMEAVNQAFDFLNKATETDLQKGEDNKKPITDQAGAVVEKSESEKEEEMNKAKEMCKGFIAEGLQKGAAIDALVKGGFTLEVATGAVESVISEASNLKENGGTIAQVTPTQVGETQTLSKADVEELFTSLKSEQTELIKGLGETISDKFDGKFDAVGKILKHVMSQNDILKGQVDTLSESNKKMEEEIGKIGSASQGPKSMTKATAVDRFNKSETAGLPVGTNVYSISSKEDREALTTILDLEIEKSRTTGRKPAEILERAVAEIEMCKSLPNEIRPFLQSLNIVVTK